MTTKPYYSQIRKSLNMAFDDSTFSAFCLDFFPEVYDRFSSGMRKDDKITLLLTDSRGKPTGFQSLLDAVRYEYQISHSSREALTPLINALEAYIASSPSGKEDDQGMTDSTAISGDSIDARGSQGFINKPTSSVTQVFGDQRNIKTGGGDYAEGNIDKRVGIFIEGGTTPTTTAAPDKPHCVFISSTWLDLQAEREAVEKALHRMKSTSFVGMEYTGSRPETTLAVSLADVERSQIYVGIFAHRYGSGITEAEYRKARSLDMPCLIYFKDENVAVLPSHFERVPDKIAKLEALKRELKAHHTISSFKSPDDLATQVVTDLHNQLKSGATK